MLEASQHYQVVLQYEKLILILRFAKDLTEKLKKIGHQGHIILIKYKCYKIFLFQFQLYIYQRILKEIEHIL